MTSDPSCNDICAGVCNLNGCGINLLDPCGPCVDPPPPGEGGNTLESDQTSESDAQPVSVAPSYDPQPARDALLNFILHDPLCAEVRNQLQLAIKASRTS